MTRGPAGVVRQAAKRGGAPQDYLLTRWAETEVDGKPLCEEDISGFFQLQEDFQLASGEPWPP
ncbi:hypothetical protein [Archangium sp.]|uniref:hypothetical protein n=1 Tax=Archangium sp. TaxID=1872627 RepID=UPI00389A8EBC